MDFQIDFKLAMAGLQSSSRQAKLNAMDAVQKRLDGGSVAEWTCQESMLTEMCRDVVDLMKDSSEMVQERAIRIYAQFVNGELAVDGSLPNLFNLLRIRLGGESFLEESEEIRLLLVGLLESICTKKGKSIPYYLDDYLTILAKALADLFGNVRVAACHCLISLLPIAPSADLYTRIDPILDTLIATFTHSQAKVRAANTHAIGYTIHYGNGKRVGDVWRLLAQRVIDSHHTVRQTVFAVLHFWMTHFRDRYSYWSRSVPLLLSGLFDELSDVRTETERLWREVGAQYEEENRELIREKYAGDDVIVANYPPAYTRPTMGCRVLVKTVFFNILPSILNDLKEWQEHIRIQSVRLLFQMMLHVEGHTVILLDKILPTLVQVAKDESRVVVAEVRACAELIGRFTEPKIYCELLVERMEDAAHLVVLSGILQGVDRVMFRPYADVVLRNIWRLSRTQQVSQQFYCLECVRIILGVVGFDSTGPLGYSIFKILTMINGLTSSADLLKEVSLVMSLLASRLDFTQPSYLYLVFSETFLTDLIGTGDSHIWLASSFEHKILQSFLLEAGLLIFLKHFSILAPVVKKNLQPSSGVQVRFDIYRLIIDIVQADTVTPTEKSARLSCQIISEFFFPNMTWTAGRSNAIMRAACCVCLAVLMDHGIIDFTTLSLIKADFLGKLVALSRDECQETQRAVARITRSIVTSDNSIAGVDLKALYPVFLKGLDESAPVRFECLRGLDDLFMKTAKLREKTTFLTPCLEEICCVLMIHMSDSDPEVAREAQECLKTGADIMRKYLQKLVTEEKAKKKCTKQCDLLHDYLLMTNSAGDK